MNKDFNNVEAKMNIVEAINEIRNCFLYQKELWSIDDLCSFTGFSKKYIYKLTSLRLIPFVKAYGGSKLFFDREEIISWLSAKKYPISKAYNELDLHFKVAKIHK